MTPTISVAPVDAVTTVPGSARRGDAQPPAGVTALTYCIACDNPLNLRTEGGNRYERRALLDCDNCGKTWLLIVTLTPKDIS